jgi:hypothetical protein
MADEIEDKVMRAAKLAEPVKVFTVAHVPQGLAQAWLQHLRDFDVAHPGCHFEVLTESPTLSAAEMIEMTKIEPDLTFSQIIERTKAAPDDKPVVHILNYGLPLCRFMYKAPVDWPRNHLWVGFYERDDANCPNCLKTAESMPCLICGTEGCRYPPGGPPPPPDCRLRQIAQEIVAEETGTDATG